MHPRQWEQELHNRQRNIVFPDTVRNYGNFYRTLLRGGAAFSGIQRFGLVLLSIAMLFSGCWALAWSIAGLLHFESAFPKWLFQIVYAGVGVALCLFGAMLIFRAVFAAAPSGPNRQSRPRRHAGRIRKR